MEREPEGGAAVTLNQLLYFETIAETGSLRQAARKLYIAQPSLSVSMMKLEQELKVELFVHQGRKAELTEAGVQFLGHVKKIMKEINETKVHMERLGMNRETSVRIGCITPILQNYLPGMMQEFLRIPGHEAARFSFSTGNTAELIRGLKEGQYDFLICSEAEAQDVDMKVLWGDRLVLIGPAGGRTGGYSWDDIRRLTLVGYEKGSQMFLLLEEISRRYHLDLSFTFSAPNETAIAALAEHGMGYAIIPYTEEMEGYRISVHDLPEQLVRNTCLATLANDRTVGRMAQEFIRFLLEKAGSGA